MSVSIRTRLLLLVMSVLVPAVVAALWIIWQTWLDERRAVEGHLRDSTRALTTVIDQELRHRAVIARVLSLSRMLDEAPAIAPEQLRLFEQQARRAMQGLDGWVELRTEREELLNTGAAPGASARKQAAGAAGQALVEAPLVGALQAGPAGAGLRAAVTHPVQRGGRTLLNLSVTILPQELQKIIDRQQLPPDWTAAVIDSRGTVVARQPGGQTYTGRPATADLLQKMRVSDEAMFESVNLDGLPVTAYFSTLPHGWTFLTAVPTHKLVRDPTRAVLAVAAGALLLLSLGAAGALLVSRQIMRPVYALKEAAAALKAGGTIAAQRTGIVEFDQVSDALGDASQAIERSRTELQRRVDEAIARTREAEQRSASSRRVEALGRLTGGVAHDFNNLLGVISNSAHLIERRSSGPEMALPVAAILRSVEVGSRLTGHLQRFAGQHAVRPQALSLDSALAGMRELLETVLGKRIELELGVAADIWPVIVDLSELELALINLALNARDASSGSAHVALSARNAEPSEHTELAPGRYVLISFSDDGCGVEAALAEHVFEPFFTTKPAGQGTGLGLSQVLGFCVQAGGTARLASSPGAGTTVSMLLPVAQGPSAGERAAAPPAEGRLADVRVLLVDDNEALRDATAGLLASFGCRLVCAASAEEALRLFDADDGIDVVLSDVMMPGAMDGPALGHALRQRRAGLPVVLISGYNSATIDRREFEVLRKPCTPVRLMETLCAALDRRPAAGGA